MKLVQRSDGRVVHPATLPRIVAGDSGEPDEIIATADDVVVAEEQESFRAASLPAPACIRCGSLVGGGLREWRYSSLADLSNESWCRIHAF